MKALGIGGGTDGTPQSLDWSLGGNALSAIKNLGTQSNHDVPVIANNVEAARFTTAQRLLLGTTASITANTLSPALQIAGNDSNKSNAAIYRYSANNAQGRITFAKSRNAAVGSHSVVSAADALGSVDFTGSDGTNFILSSQLLSESDSAASANIVPGRLRFLTANAAGAAVEALRIDSKQNVVHGTAALPTTATGGFTWIQSCAGAPTGVPAAPYTNAGAVIVDTVNSRLYVLVGATWKYAALT